MTRPDRNTTEERVHLWLAERHAELTAHLAGSLDFDAGLRENMLLADEYETLVQELRGAVDIDAGSTRSSTPTSAFSARQRRRLTSCRPGWTTSCAS